MKRYGITLPDRQLACVPIQSPEGQAYLAAMRAAANFAWANRQAMLHFVRGSLPQDLRRRSARIDLIYDVCHNIAKREQHTMEGGSATCWCTARARRARFRPVTATSRRIPRTSASRC